MTACGKCSLSVAALCGAIAHAPAWTEPCHPVDLLLDSTSAASQSAHGYALDAQGIYVAVLDPAFNAGGFNTCFGAVTIWKPDPDNENPDWIIDSIFDDDDVGVASRIGDQSNDFAPGRRLLAGAGDVDLDGHPDWVVSGEYACGTSPGDPLDAVWVFTVSSGGACGSAPQLKAMITPHTSTVTNFGQAVDGGGDIDGDGKSDIVVGAPIDGSSGSGLAIVYWGYQCASGVGTFSNFDPISGPPSHPGFATAVQIIPDINGDGRDEVAVGDWTSDTVEIYTLNPATSTFSLHSTVNPPQGTTSTKFGSVIGHYETSDPTQSTMLLVGDPRYYSGSDQVGAVYAYKWNTTSSAWIHQATLTGEDDLDWFGSSVSSANDFAGGGSSGSDNFVVGAPGRHQERGMAYVFDGDTFSEIVSHGGEKPCERTSSNPCSIHFGHSVAAADTTKEVGIVVGSPGYVGGGGLDGRVYWIPDDIVANRRTIEVHIPALLQGSPTTFKVSNVDPNEPFGVFQSGGVGCSTQFGVQTELFMPTHVGSGVADANGDKTLNITLNVQPGLEYYFQVIQSTQYSPRALSSNVEVRIAQ